AGAEEPVPLAARHEDRALGQGVGAAARRPALAHRPLREPAAAARGAALGARAGRPAGVRAPAAAGGARGVRRRPPRPAVTASRWSRPRWSGAALRGT